MIAAAAIILFLLRPREPQTEDNVVYVKGVGEVVIDVVRERAGFYRARRRPHVQGPAIASK